MANGKVQTDPVIRKSKIRKGIQRTLSTAKFESIVIYDEIEEEAPTVDEKKPWWENWFFWLGDEEEASDESPSN